MIGCFPPHRPDEPPFFTERPVVLLRPVEMAECDGEDTRPVGSPATVQWMPSRCWYLCIDGLIARTDVQESVDFRFV